MVLSFFSSLNDMLQQISQRFCLRWLFVLVGMLSFVASATARVWTPDEVPVPRYENRMEYVSNPEQILSQSAVDSLNVMLHHLEVTKGVQTLVAVLDKLEGDDPYSFAMSLARKHGVGSKKTNTGLVIVLATGDRSYQFLTGEGLEGTLPDGQIQLIEDRYFIPLLKQGDWDGAMLAAVKAINQVAQGDHELVAPDEESSSPSFGFGLAMFVVFVLFLVFVVASSQPKCPHCQKRKAIKVSEHQEWRLYNGRKRRCVVTTYRCTNCQQVFKQERYDDEGGGSSGTGLLAGMLLGGLMRGGRGSGGSSYGGGSFGGGSFGGGGSGGRF